MNDQTRTSRKMLNLAVVGQSIAAVGAAGIISYLAYLIWVPEEALVVIKQDIPGIQTLPDATMIMLAKFIAAIPAVALVFALWQAWRFFKNVKIGQPYSAEAQASLKWLGRAAIFCAIAGVLVRTAVTLIMTSANPPGQKMLVVGFGSTEIAAAMIGILVFVFANVVREAAATAQENASFV